MRRLLISDVYRLHRTPVKLIHLSPLSVLGVVLHGTPCRIGKLNYTFLTKIFFFLIKKKGQKNVTMNRKGCEPKMGEPDPKSKHNVN